MNFNRKLTPITENLFMSFKDWLRTCKCLHLQGMSDCSLINRLCVQREGYSHRNPTTAIQDYESIFWYRRTFKAFSTRHFKYRFARSRIYIVRNLRKRVINDLTLLHPTDVIRWGVDLMDVFE